MSSVKLFLTILRRVHETESHFIYQNMIINANSYNIEMEYLNMIRIYDYIC